LLLGRSRNPIENIGRLCAITGNDGEPERGDEKRGGENCRGARQGVGSAARRHETGTAADTKPSTFGTLNQYHADKGEHDHEVDDDKYGFHRSTLAMPAPACASAPEDAAQYNALMAFPSPGPEL